MRRNLCRSLRSPFAEADPETQPKNLRGSSRGRLKQKRLQAILAEGSRKGLRGRVVSVMKLPKNKSQNSVEGVGMVLVSLGPKVHKPTFGCLVAWCLLWAREGIDSFLT